MKTWQEAPKALGRPGHTKEARYRALRKVGREHRQQGKEAGWRPIDEALEGRIPTRLVQEALARWKGRRKRRHRGHLEKVSKQVTVLAQGVIWAQDGTHLGRDGSEDAEAQVMKERAILKTLSLSVGPAATAKDVLSLLKASKEAQGGFPLVWQTDNESIYLDKKVQDFLVQEQIVHLLSRPRHPMDNGAAEVGIRELKKDAGLGKGVKVKRGEAALRILKSAVQLNTCRLRSSRGYLTSEELAKRVPFWYGRVKRGRFYEETRKAVKKAVYGKKGNRARQAEREAIYGVLEKYGLVKQSRGDRSQKTLRWEIIL
jgi:transposase InsO family protein